MTAATTTAPSPFEGDAEYLEAEFAWLRVRCARLTADRHGLDSERGGGRSNGRSYGQLALVEADESRRRAAALAADEQRLRTSLDARLALHRADPAAVPLGLDVACAEHGLGPRARLVLIALCVPAAGGQELMDAVFDELGITIFTGLTVEAVTTILKADGLRKRLELLDLFRHDGPLVTPGLVVVDFCAKLVTPEDVFPARVSLTGAAFRTLTGTRPVSSQGRMDRTPQ